MTNYLKLWEEIETQLEAVQFGVLDMYPAGALALLLKFQEIKKQHERDIETLVAMQLKTMSEYAVAQS